MRLSAKNIFIFIARIARCGRQPVVKMCEPPFFMIISSNGLQRKFYLHFTFICPPTTGSGYHRGAKQKGGCGRVIICHYKTTQQQLQLQLQLDLQLLRQLQLDVRPGPSCESGRNFFLLWFFFYYTIAKWALHLPLQPDGLLIWFLYARRNGVESVSAAQALTQPVRPDKSIDSNKPKLLPISQPLSTVHGSRFEPLDYN